MILYTRNNHTHSCNSVINESTTNWENLNDVHKISCVIKEADLLKTTVKL